MRRKDREITDSKKVDDIILSCHCVRLGLIDNDRVYIVPLNFGFRHKNNKRIFYFHSAKSGRKIDIINRSQYASFEMDTGYNLHEGCIACDCTAAFQSIVGEGSISIINSKKDKIEALNILMNTITKKENYTYLDDMLEEVFVFKLEVDIISCKEHN